MRRKINLYVLFIVLVSNVLIISLALFFFYFQSHHTIEHEKKFINSQITREFKNLKPILSMIEKQVYLKYQNQIIKFGNEVLKKYPDANGVPLDALKRMSYTINVEQIYLVNREGIILNSTTTEGLNQNIKGRSLGFQRFFDNLFLTHQSGALKFGFSPVDNRLSIFVYYVPEGSKYALVMAIDFINFLECEYPGMANTWLFYRLNEVIPEESDMVESLDVFICDEETRVSVFNRDQKFVIDSKSFNTLFEKGKLALKTDMGEDYYQVFTFNSEYGAVPVQLILKVEYNYDSYRATQKHIVLILFFALLLILLILSFVSPIISERVLIKKIAIINGNLNAIGKANYNDLKAFRGKDELSEILTSISSLKDSVIKREEQFKEAKIHAEVADKLKSAFLANMSHEIRTPLNAVVGFAQLLRDANPSPQDVERYVGLINTNSTRLLQLISDIIDLSQIESGQMRIIPRPVCLNELFSELYATANSKILNQNQIVNNKEIVVELQKESLPSGECIITDPYRLKQIMEQLIDNAVKFTCKGKIQIGFRLNGGFIDFFVQDTGVGIAKENLTRIFERFVQAEDYLTREYGGTGLGLAICRELAIMLGGSIRVESQIDRGSTFWFRVPYRTLPKN
ncbi:MAG TPA: hypothetical protein DCQ26_10205 [Marinilabiliales bacterium]|nr:hypothetical protein [Marinilabiliales bacterium]HAZ02772.1 hypothetical protein [Marinilabiliales bacterium]HBO76268.1 hypothetical protein [Marinilabiliales bacterium]HBX84190.1 hypothetical protein [Marinilabiliales bacterium]HBY54154.1 hypothetical protein [Marinilabiliales bacterium]